MPEGHRLLLDAPSARKVGLHINIFVQPTLVVLSVFFKGFQHPPQKNQEQFTILKQQLSNIYHRQVSCEHFTVVLSIQSY